MKSNIMGIPNFSFSRTPKIVFGPNTISKLGSLAASFGKNVLIVRGSSSLLQSPFWDSVISSLNENSITYSEFEISSEPSPFLVDTAVRLFFEKSIKCVIAIGGGSVIDAGKAISAMLYSGKSVIDFLEVVGKYKPDGKKIPFIAIPTTSGTGSEATANAVLSEIGPNGFKRSLRHENYVPDIALVDPNLSISCPQHITAACGMDALTQILESYVSTKASPISDSLIEYTLPNLFDSINEAVFNGNTNIESRIKMSYSALISGITLANSGLGVVHGLASILGALYPIPHGVVCGTLLAPATKYTINKIIATDPDSIFLSKYSNAYGLLTNDNSGSILEMCNSLIEHLYGLQNSLKIKYLSDYGMKKSDLDHISFENCNKNNPIFLDNNNIRSILLERIK